MAHGLPGQIMDQRSYLTGDPVDSSVPLLTPGQLYKEIKSLPSYQESSVIVLYICHAADKAPNAWNQSSFAQQLAEKSGKPVAAFSGVYNAATGTSAGGMKMFY